MKALSEYNQGDIYKGELITTLYAAKADYLIFEGNNSGEVTIATDNDELRKRCTGISSKISLISEYLESDQERRKFVDQIGLAYGEAIEGNITEANVICDGIISRIESFKKKTNVGRFYYLLSCLATVILVLIISYFLKKFDFIPEIVPHFFFMSYASIGGFLSVAKGIKKIQINSSDFGWFQIIYGAIRILIAMFSGLIIYVLLQSDLILPQLDDNNFYVVCLLAIAAGFSESMIPNLLKTVENNNKK